MSKHKERDRKNREVPNSDQETKAAQETAAADAAETVDSSTEAGRLVGLSNRLMKLMAEKRDGELADRALTRMKALFDSATALPLAQKMVSDEAEKAKAPVDEIWNMTRGIMENICSTVDFEFLRSRVIGDLFGEKGPQLAEMSDEALDEAIDAALEGLSQADEQLVERTSRGLAASMIQTWQADRSRRESEKKLESSNSHLQKENDRLRKIANERAELVAVLKKDYENLKNRSREREELMQKNAAETVAKDLLPVMDSFGRALSQNLGGDERLTGFMAGFQQIALQFRNALEKHGVTEIICMGQDFDPEIHEAIVHLDTADAPDNSIVDVVETGYMINDRILRHPKVVVARNQ